jgi:hypothetical protein
VPFGGRASLESPRKSCWSECLANVDGLCIERDRLVGEQRRNIPALIRSSMDQQSGASGEMVRPQSG